MYLSGQQPDRIVQATSHYGQMAYSLGALVVVVVFVVPIEHPHKEELEQNWIGEVFRRASVNLLGDTTSVSPQMIIPMALCKDIVVPAIVVRPLLSGQHQTAVHMTRDLKEGSAPSITTKAGSSHLISPWVRLCWTSSRVGIVAIVGTGYTMTLANRCKGRVPSLMRRIHGGEWCTGWLWQHDLTYGKRREEAT